MRSEIEGCMRRIADWSAALAALLAALVAVTITTTGSQLSSVQEDAVTNRVDWFAAARGRDGIPGSGQPGAERSEGMNR
jgi:hypothetical protein